MALETLTPLHKTLCSMFPKFVNIRAKTGLQQALPSLTYGTWGSVWSTKAPFQSAALSCAASTWRRHKPGRYQSQYKVWFQTTRWNLQTRAVQQITGHTPRYPPSSAYNRERLRSFNAKDFKQFPEYILDMLCNTGILWISETWIRSHEMNLINNIVDNGLPGMFTIFNKYGTSEGDGSYTGRPFLEA